MTAGMHLMIRTPHEVVLDDRVDGARVPTATGQVGLRARQEPLVLAVEAGLIVIHVAGADRFAATAGGLLEGDRARSILYTPFAAIGAPGDILDALDRALATPDSELAARRHLGELEERILREVGHGGRGGSGGAHG